MALFGKEISPVVKRDKRFTLAKILIEGSVKAGWQPDDEV